MSYGVGGSPGREGPVSTLSLAHWHLLSSERASPGPRPHSDLSADHPPSHLLQFQSPDFIPASPSLRPETPYSARVSGRVRVCTQHPGPWKREARAALVTHSCQLWEQLLSRTSV
jgi:hypothetical protein